VTPTEIAAAEDAANGVIWEDRSVTIRFVDAAEAAALPLRKESARTGALRIVEIDGIDVSACGGTHVARTGAIGIAVVSSWERFKGGTRLEFRCGVRALRAHRFLRDTVAAVVRLASVAPGELAQGIERIQSENKEMKRRAIDLESRLAGHEAGRLAATAIEAGGIHAVVSEVPGFEMNGIKTIAQSITSRPAYVAILWTAATPASVVVARAAGVALDAAGLLKALIAKLGGKGGGRPELAQGTLTATRAQIVEAVNELLAQGRK
ncbi:MAG: DHHA1 domain-containing protein, partial [Burkholderiales bacterium]